MPERTFVLVKPDHVELAYDILAQLDGQGARIMTARVEAVPKEVIEAHYSPHRGKGFFEYMTKSFVDRPVVIAVYECAEVIQRFIELIGPTDPSKAPKETIRGKFSNDSLEKAIAEKRPVRNVIHRSDSVAEAEREIAVWRQFFGCDGE